MIRTMLKVLLLACFLPCFSWAAGLGELKVISALGQPLRAEIELVSPEEGDARAVEAHIAPVDVFSRAGVEYNPLLAQIGVRILTRPDGRPYILLSSPEIVNDPYLDVLIDLSWPKGQIEREYTLLFDPPELAKSPSVSPPVSLHERRLEPKSPPSSPFKTEYGPVRRGETLGKIALATKPEGVTLEQMLVALYQANDDAFIGKNMNRLEAGKILRIPEKTEIDAVSRHEADKVVKVQTADWNAYRQRLASSAVERGSGLKRSVSGKIAASQEENPVPPPPKEVLKLSKGEASSATASEEEKAAQIRAMNQASERILMLEKNITEMKRLLALKNQALARAGAKASAPVVVEKPLETQASSMFDNPILLGAAGGVVIGLAGIGLLVSRRRRKPVLGRQPLQADRIELEKHEAKSARAEPAMPEAPDPLEEAQLFFSYKRYAQAEEVLKEALQVNPANFDAYILLMNVHAANQEREKLEAAARRLQAAEPPNEIWDRAMEIGLAADPENPFYGGVVREGEPAVIDFAEPSRESLDFDLDFDLGKEAGEHVDLHLGDEAEKQEVDMDVLPEENVKAPAEEKVVDFDLASMMIEPETAPAEEKAVDFDLASMMIEPETAPAEEKVVDFDLASMMIEPETVPAEEQAVDFDLASMIELPAEEPIPEYAHVEVPEAEIPKEERDLSSMNEQAEEAPFGSDASKASFDISDIPSLVESSRQLKKQELSDIDLHLGEEPKEISGPKDPSWYEVATKLDLAKVYQEMGDHEGAREILEEVMSEGDSDQKATARAMLASLSKS